MIHQQDSVLANGNDNIEGITIVPDYDVYLVIMFDGEGLALRYFLIDQGDIFIDM